MGSLKVTRGYRIQAYSCSSFTRPSYFLRTSFVHPIQLIRISQTRRKRQPAALKSRVGGCFLIGRCGVVATYKPSLVSVHISHVLYLGKTRDLILGSFYFHICPIYPCGSAEGYPWVGVKAGVSDAYRKTTSATPATVSIKPIR